MASVEVGTWLQAQAAGRQSAPDRIGGAMSGPGLGEGASGRALFFAELYAATSDSTFRTSALAESRAALAMASSDSAGFALYRGLSGIAFSLSETGLITDDEGLRHDGRRLFRQIAASAPSLSGGGWGEVYDLLSGWTGVGLALLYAHAHFGEEAFRHAAVEIGDSLLMVADTVARGQLRWFRDSTGSLDLPNFSHGTAGVGFFLARLGSTTGMERFSSGAAAAVRYLDAVADTAEGLFLVPYGVPNDDYATPYDIGWAHGPAGTARLHYAAWIETASPQVERRLHASAHTLLASGVPGPSADSSIWRGPFRIDRRFGTSGSADFLFDLGQAFGEQAYVDVALQIVDHTLAAASTDPDGLFWSVPLYGFQSGEGNAAFTGYFYGAAGLGLSLLRAHYAVTGRHQVVRLPDDPFGLPDG